MEICDICGEYMLDSVRTSVCIIKWSWVLTQTYYLQKVHQWSNIAENVSLMAFRRAEIIELLLL